MKTHIFPAIKLTFFCFIIFVVLYSAIVWAIALMAPNNGKGDNGIIGQTFTDDKYFWSRPSAVGYNAAGSAGSNKGPSNPDYLQTVQARIDTFRIHNPEIPTSEIPVELVTASGSGLDPHISPQAAKIQVPRIAKVRKISEDKLNSLISQQTESRILGIFGTERINVLSLNKALDSLK